MSRSKNSRRGSKKARSFWAKLCAADKQLEHQRHRTRLKRQRPGEETQREGFCLRWDPWHWD